MALEFAARHAQKWGGVIAFTGGLIGNKIYLENYFSNSVASDLELNPLAKMYFHGPRFFVEVFDPSL